MSETLREKIENFPFSRITVGTELFIDFVSRDEVLAAIDESMERQQHLEKIEIPLDLVIAKEQTRALIAISQTLGSIHEELKRMNRG